MRKTGRQGTHAVAVLSHRFWQERLGADPNVIGRTIGLNRRNFTVIGVTPADFAGHLPAIPPDLFIPMMMMGAARPGFDAFDNRFSNWFAAIGRLAPNATVEQANTALAATFTRLREIDADRYERRSARAIALGAVPAAGRTPVTAFLALILGLASMILLITCANVAGMLVARAAAREKEIAIRLALGSGRARLVRQLIVESTLLFLVGGLGGLMLTLWSTDALSSLQLPVPVRLNLDFRADGLVLACGLGVALLTGIVFGLAPALQSTSPSLSSALKSESARGCSRGGRMRRVFVMGQIGLSVVLLLCAGLFLRSLQRAGDVDTGFDRADVRMISFDLSLDGYDEERGTAFIATVLERARGLAGVSAASVSGDLPMDLSSHEMPAYPEGFQSTDDFPGLPSHFNVVSEGYFETLRIPVRRGRAFQTSDQANSLPVALVGRTFAERAWPEQEPIGKRVSVEQDEGTAFTVVGVADDVRNQTIMQTPEPMMYLLFAQHYRPALNLLVQSSAPAAALSESMRGVIRGVDPNLSVTPVQSVEEYTGIGILPQRIAAGLTTSLGLLALLLSALGVYGVVAYTVAQQTREIGVRLALGASRRDVLALVTKRGLRLAIPGLVLGVAAGLGLARLIRGFILGVAPGDPATFAGGPLLLLAVIAVATLVPARRASAIHPATALRVD